MYFTCAGVGTSIRAPSEGRAATATALHLEAESAGHTFATSDRTEGMTAFHERRKPRFEGK